MKCQYCTCTKKSVDFCYCKYCDQHLCLRHRLPEEHQCPNLDKLQNIQRKRLEETLIKNKMVKSKI